MEAQFDQDTTRKVDLINKKIDEINLRRMGCRTTKIEDELDQQELDDYIISLKLTDEQRKLIEKFNRSNEKHMPGKSTFYYAVVFISVLIQIYLSFVIYEILMKPEINTWETLYLFVLAGIFIFNLVQVLKFLRIMR
jgi:hypothetical protein